MYGVSKISITEQVALVSFTKAPADFLYVSDFFEQVAKHDINIDMISQSAPQGGSVTLSFTAPDEDLPKLMELIGSFKKTNPSIKTLVSSGNVKVSLYGEEMRETPGVAAKAIHTVSHAADTVYLITTSEIDISFLVADEALPAVTEAIETAFSVEITE